jgi:outer membrane protein assembly factor BamD (BamD/ComL family)
VTLALIPVLMLAQVNNPMLNLEPEGLDRAPERVEAEQETDPLKYRAKARALFELAEKLLKGDLGIEAAQTFRTVIEKFPFSRYAVLAEVGHAQALAAQGEAEGALDGFTRFLKQHPGHPKTADVRYAIIETSWAERPGDFALLPPAYERDLEDARATVIAADAFLRFHSNDQRASKARSVKTAARQLLYQQAVFLARWTADQGRHQAALSRWQMARTEFSEQPVTDPDKAWLKALTQRASAHPVKHPEEPKLHPEASVTAKESQP